MTTASTALRSPGPSAAATAIARMIVGKANTRSAMRMIDAVDPAGRSSPPPTRRRRRPASASITSSSASGIDDASARDHPAEHVAARGRRCRTSALPFGLWKRSKSWASGSYGAMRSPNTSSTAHIAAITIPATVSGRRTRQRPPPATGTPLADCDGLVERRLRRQYVDHYRRTRGSITPYSTSTTRLSTMYTSATNSPTPMIAGQIERGGAAVGVLCRCRAR